MRKTSIIALSVALLSVARWGTAGLWWTISLTAVGRAVAMMALWRSGVWKRRAV